MEELLFDPPRDRRRGEFGGVLKETLAAAAAVRGGKSIILGRRRRRRRRRWGSPSKRRGTWKELCSGGRRDDEDSKELLAVLRAFDCTPLRTRFRQRSHAIFDFVSTVKQSANIFRFQLFVGLVEEIFKGEDAFARGGEEGMDEIEDSRKILFDFGFRAERDGGRRVEAVFFEFTFEDAADVLPRNAFVFEIIVFSSIHATILHLHLPNGFVDVAFCDDFLFHRRRRRRRRRRSCRRNQRREWKRGRRRGRWFGRVEQHRRRRGRRRCRRRSDPGRW